MIEPLIIRIQNIETGDIGNLNYRNLGWDDELGAYVSEFSTSSRTTYSIFHIDKYLEFECPDPQMRLSYDCEHLERKWDSILQEGGL